jgi:16S rRNA (guanine966-N2)-methyltransferase
VRITGGMYRGKQIVAPETLPVRPTTDFAKTGLFNMLSNRYDMKTLKVLDLYCGTGSITYEFLSRGCREIYCVDNSSACTSFISTTLKNFNAAENAKVICSSANDFLHKTNEKFDIIFADPPFKDDVSVELINVIFENKKLAANGIFILEHQSAIKMESRNHFIFSRKYGNITFTFFSEDKPQP